MRNYGDSAAKQSSCENALAFFKEKKKHIQPKNIGTPSEKGNWNHNEISPCLPLQEPWSKSKCRKGCGDKNPDMLLVRIQIDTAIIENSKAVSQKSRYVI